MNKLVILILVVVSLWSDTTALLFSQSWEWEIQAEGLATRWQGIDAVDSNVAVAFAWNKQSTGRQGIFRTLNGGKSWHDLPWLEERIGGIVDISITDSLNFWVLTPFAIDHTSDAGRTWELQYSDNSTTSWFNYIEMFDSLNGIAMGDGLPKHPILILRTTDGGKTWISQNQSRFINAFSGDIWHCIQFVTPEIGFGRFSYFGVNDSTLFLQKTVDGGKTWQSLPLNQRDFWTIRFYNEELGLAAWKANQKIFRTLDGGETWNSFATNLDGGWPADIEFFPNDPSKILIVFGSYLDCHLGLIQGNHLVFSRDTDKTWTELNISDIGKMFDIKMIDDQHGWIGGYEGIFHFSTKSTSSVMTEKATNLTFVLNQNYPNPLNSTTAIRFQLPYEMQVSLKIFNIQGEDIRTLINHNMLPGMQQVEWDGTDYSGKKVASGIYIYQLIAGEFKQAHKMTLVY